MTSPEIVFVLDRVFGISGFRRDLAAGSCLVAPECARRRLFFIEMVSVSKREVAISGFGRDLDCGARLSDPE